MTTIINLSCPHCNADLGAATGVNTMCDPKPGDAGICFHCGGLMIFDDNLRPRFPTPIELDHYTSNRAVKRVMEEFKKREKLQ